MLVHNTLKSTFHVVFSKEPHTSAHKSTQKLDIVHQAGSLYCILGLVDILQWDSIKGGCTAMFSCCMKDPETVKRKEGSSQQQANNNKSHSHSGSPQKKQPSPVKQQPNKQASPIKEQPCGKSKSKSPAPKSPSKQTPTSGKVPASSQFPVASPDQVKINVASDLGKKIADLHSLLDHNSHNLSALQAKAKELKEALCGHNAPIDSKMASDLAGLVARLETVTTKLEGIASGGGGDVAAAPGKWFACCF